MEDITKIINIMNFAVFTNDIPESNPNKGVVALFTDYHECLTYVLSTGRRIHRVPVHFYPIVNGKQLLGDIRVGEDGCNFVVYDQDNKPVAIFALYVDTLDYLEDEDTQGYYFLPTIPSSSTSTIR